MRESARELNVAMALTTCHARLVAANQGGVGKLHYASALPTTSIIRVSL
jgi:hypothetical protein